jgi:D-aminoacyl-tRNA deacylase
MIVVIQRVTQASVTVEKETIGTISTGILCFVGIEEHDSIKTAHQCLNKIMRLRIFSDHNGKMNLNCTDVNGGLLLVPQFTLTADTNNGNRPSFTTAAPAHISKPLFRAMVQAAQEQYPNVQCGKFGADMQIQLINDGPATFILRFD